MKQSIKPVSHDIAERKTKKVRRLGRPVGGTGKFYLGGMKCDFSRCVITTEDGRKIVMK